ncbi:penicillin-binding protein 1A [Hypericibacter terrae]|uniref:Penicillin-binding protein 1A n=1 Tax=Hypericibacter terrae TaxID=2602015 RepID=A0A5J6MJ72_9PROT|nr:PBP1A family penicillin-binding protein [Hypericibacter terrae]QEX14746.1 penicillin-binding protein 1A [Hypericibacter terrae]
MAGRGKKKDSGRKAKRKGGESWRQRHGLLLSFAKWGLVATVWSFFLGLCFVGWLAYDLPDVSRLNEIDHKPSVTLLAADGTILASYGDLYGKTVTLQELPGYLPQAVIATEDRRFYSHFGLDLRGLARAVYVNLRSGAWVQGGSTITQQLAKNVFLTPARTLRRKGQEVLLALWLEHNFTKDQLLELYLNRVYFGAGTYGVDAAARRYFGKPAAEVTRYEAALLAGLLKAPSRYSPFNDRDLAQARAKLVLSNMVAAGYLTQDESDKVAAEGFGHNTPARSGPLGQYFADWVLDQLPGFVGYSDRDLVVTTTLDPVLQRQAEAKLTEIFMKDGPPQDASQAALVSMTPEGAVKAMVGGLDYGNTQFNRAVQAQRQPGSAFKPFLFLTAFENGFDPDSHFTDAPISIGNWKPDNYNDRYYGDVTLREAFARSLNSVAAQLIQRVGPKRVAQTAERLGINSKLTATPSLALGTSEVNLLEMTGAYAVFANRGEGVWPYAIAEVRDRDGNLLYAREGSGPGRIVAPRYVLEMQDIMSSVIEWGTGKAAQIGRPEAGKTGTTQDYRDAWFIGYTAELVTGVWVGNDDGHPMKKVAGSGLPVKIWQGFMAAALDKELPRPLPWPGGNEPLVAGVPDGTAATAAADTAPSGTIIAPDPVTAAKETGNDSFANFIERLVNQRDNKK